MLMFRENIIKAKLSKVLRFGKNKIENERKNVKKQDLNRLVLNAKAEMKEKKPPMLSENQIKAKYTVIKYNGKGLRNVKKQDLDRLDHNAKELNDIMYLEEKKAGKARKLGKENAGQDRLCCQQGKDGQGRGV